ncbi:MAG: Mrp/NBP35 family ATP-binding protein [Candidatus Bathyarchaeota archaeon]|nr:Mrp/NBP35 family ATP-binding protein [Candidatus Bathyarchaeota archaeon]
MSGIKKIIAVSSGKGGVGKSVIASTIALLFADKGLKIGLLDLDFTSPTTHVVLNARNLKPVEDRGVAPPEVYGVKYMSLVFYLGDQVSPLRGADLSNVLLEVLAITRWGSLDILLIDMPPGISDLMLDVLKYIRGARFLIITTPSKMAFETVRKLLALLKGLKAPIIGVIENMKMNDATYIRREVEALGERFLGEIHFDGKLEEALGSVESLLKTSFAREVESILPMIENS